MIRTVLSRRFTILLLSSIILWGCGESKGSTDGRDLMHEWMGIPANNVDSIKETMDEGTRLMIRLDSVLDTRKGLKFKRLNK